ncbi:MAG TPA: hypothetical protein VF482_02035, partial [Trebonia sp.]
QAAWKMMWPAWRCRRSFLPAGTGSASRGVLGGGLSAGRQGAECLPEFRADPGRPQRGRIEPDLDAAPPGVQHRAVTGPDPESVPALVLPRRPGRRCTCTAPIRVIGA